jgi:large subunit ribosomal protein L5
MNKMKLNDQKDTKNSLIGNHTPNLLKLYLEDIQSILMKKFGYNNLMEIPKLLSITLNMGIGDAKVNTKSLESAVSELTQISGQKPVVTKAKKDISNFKIRKGFPVGCKVTLRSGRMYEFLERMIAVALPRSRDFRGLSFKSFDGRGNYNFGIREQIIFTEINYDKIEAIKGLNVTLVTSADTDDEAYWLLKELGLPLKDKPSKIEINEAA